MRVTALLSCLLVAVFTPASFGKRRSVDLTCFLCSWNGEEKLTDEKRKELMKRWSEQKDQPMENPVKEPLLGLEAFTDMPVKSDLDKHCKSCTKSNNACARWSFYTNGKPRNVTWLCANTLERGCFVERLPNQLLKEVCICSDQNYCNGSPSTFFANTSLALLLLPLLGMLLAIGC